MRIKEASIESGLSADTIRYYEKIGILPKIGRDGAGQRVFNKDNLGWMSILYWLRKTGMPMKEMSRYAHLVHSGQETIPERVEILQRHGELLAERKLELARCEKIIENKLRVYGDPECFKAIKLNKTT